MAAFAAPEPVRITFSEPTCRLSAVSGTSCTLMLPWPSMKAYRRRAARGPWLACTPDFAIVPDPDAALTAGGQLPGLPTIGGAIDMDALRNVHRFCLTVPPTVRRDVAAFPERHWELLAWAARTGPAADELLASNPALAFAVACGHLLYPDDGAARFRDLQFLMAYHAQREVMARLGFPPTERARRILRKIQPRAVSVAGLAGLRPRMADPEIAKRLSHVRRINSGVLAMAANGTITRVSPAALQHVTAERADAEADEAARRLAEAIRLWGLVRPTAPIPVFGRAERLREVHEGLREDAARLAAPVPPIAPAPRAAGRPDARPAPPPARRRAVVSIEVGPPPREFPPPPVPGTDAIVPIGTRAMLIEEGRFQRNCVADYAGAIAAGRMAVYRVMEPQRCTLSLVPTHGIWVIDQLKASCNRAARGTTMRAVMEWLRKTPAPDSAARRQDDPAAPAAAPQVTLPW